jgi:hypothetical protein
MFTSDKSGNDVTAHAPSIRPRARIHGIASAHSTIRLGSPGVWLIRRTLPPAHQNGTVILQQSHFPRPRWITTSLIANPAPRTSPPANGHAHSAILIPKGTDSGISKTPINTPPNPTVDSMHMHRASSP